jgi:hypothetical protein
MTINATTAADEILTELGQDFTLPAVDLTSASFLLPSKSGNPLYGSTGITSVTIADMTTGTVGGTGAFDKLMASNKAHLKEQYEKGLITGDQYTKAYIELTTAAMGTALQLLLGKDHSYWQALLLQMQGRRAEIEAVTAAVQLEIAKAQLAAANRQAELTNAQYVFTLLQAASEAAKYNLVNAQIDMVNEQTEAQRAHTMDTRRDGTTPVLGSVGKQKDLYTQQIDSYQKDAQQKVAKMFLDGWITQKTLDEGLLAPTQLTNSEINEVMEVLRDLHDLNSPA